MLRIAGITTLPGTTPSDDQYGELPSLVNNMLDSWSCGGFLIYNFSIDPYPLVSGQKIYTIGPGGDFDDQRPLAIKSANVLYPTSPVVRAPVRILDDDEWANIGIQDISGAPPFQLYYDGDMDENGLGKIYLRFQPPAGYTLELYTWKRLQSTFQDSEDLAIFPPGYAEAIVWNGALRVAAMYPLESKISALAPEMARKSYATLKEFNANSPKISTEAIFEPYCSDDTRPWLRGPF